MFVYLGEMLQTNIRIDASITGEVLGCNIPKDRRIKVSEPGFFSGTFLMVKDSLAFLSVRNMGIDFFTKIKDEELMQIVLGIGDVGAYIVFMSRDRKCWGIRRDYWEKGEQDDE